MQVSVILNNDLIKKYYYDKFIKKYLWIDILVLIFGSTAAGIYLLGEKKVVALCLEGLTLFFALIVYFLNYNEMTKMVKENAESEREYIFDFFEDKVSIKCDTVHKTIKYEKIKIKKYPRMFLLKENKKEEKIYLLPKNIVKKTEWNSIYNKIKKLGGSKHARNN